MEGITSCKTSGKLRRLAGFFAEKGAIGVRRAEMATDGET
jgi:hypothetical protein